jgi:hypothetical protein
MNAVAFAAQADPTRAQRIGFAGRHDFAGRIPGWMRQPVNDGEVARRAGRGGRADRDGVDLHYAAVLHQRQLTIRNTHYNAPCRGPRFLG